jgi:DNA polymerase elongation subunit (family B)
MHNATQFIINDVDLSQNLHHLSDDDLFGLLDSAYTMSNLSMSMSITEKTFMNSMYGASSNEYNQCGLLELAEDTAAEGRFYIRAAQTIINNYLWNRWHLDYTLHDSLINHPKLKGKYKEQSVTKLDGVDYVMYIDTDSMYVNCEPIINSIGLIITESSDYVEFILALNELRLSELFKDELGDIVSKRHGENFLKFDLESIAETAFFLAKKKYIQSIAWSDGVYNALPYKHIKGKGVELIQTSRSQHARDLLKYLMELLFNDRINNDNYSKIIRYAHKLFSADSFDVQDRCEFIGMATFHNKIDYDKHGMQYTTKGANPQHKGAVRYNNIIKQQKLEYKYRPIHNDKIAWYYDEQMIPFAFHINEMPIDVMPNINSTAQFVKLILKPFERLVQLTNIKCANPLSQYRINSLE